MLRRLTARAIGSSRTFITHHRRRNARPCPPPRRLYAASSAFSSTQNHRPSFGKGVFCGQLRRESALFPYPVATLDETRDVQPVREVVETFDRFLSDKNDAARNDRESDVDPDVWENLKHMGAFGLQVPTEYGGLGLSNVGYAACAQALGQYDLGLAIVLAAHQSIGFKGIAMFGNDEQKQRYLPRVASGEWLAAYCLTEPGAGSDAASIECRAAPLNDGSYVLNGQKQWISNGDNADVMTVFARSGEAETVALIVERGFGGVTSGARERKLGIRCSSTSTVHFDNVQVPRENLLGAPGDGFRIAVRVLNAGRFGMCAGLAGTMRALIVRAARHANERQQFGRPIAEFGLVQQKLARMEHLCYATESMAYSLAASMDVGATDYAVEAAIGKIFSSEAAAVVADDALQLLGGLGFVEEGGVERFVRDLRIFRIFEGTNEVLRLLTALEGLKEAGQAMKQRSTLQMGVHVMRDFRHACPTLHGVHAALAQSTMAVEFNTASFAQQVDRFLWRHRNAQQRIPERQHELALMADCAIHLYAASTVLARCSAALDSLPTNQRNTEQQVAEAFCHYANRRVQWCLAQLHQLHHSQRSDANRDEMLARAVTQRGAHTGAHPLGIDWRNDMS